MELRPPGDQRRTVEGLELVEVRPVDDAGDHLSGVERHLGVGRHQAEQLLLGVARRKDRLARGRPSLVPVQPSDDASAEPNGVVFVDGEVVGEARGACVHVGAPERLVVGVLARRHLHQRRTGQEHLGALLDHHDVVRHARDVRPAGRRVAEHEGDDGDARRREPGEVAEHGPTGDEDLLLGRKVRAAGFGQVDHRQPVGQRDLVGPQHLLEGPRVARPAPHGGIAGADHAFDARDDTDARHHAGPDGEVAAPCGEPRQFHERRVLVQQQLDAFANRQLAAVSMPLDVFGAAPADRGGVLGVEVVNLIEQGLPVGSEVLAGGVEGGRQPGHEVYPSSLPAKPVMISLVPPPMPRIRMSR